MLTQRKTRQGRETPDIERPNAERSDSLMNRIYSFIPSIPRRRSGANLRPQSAPNLETRPTSADSHANEQEPLLPSRLERPVDSEQLCPYDPTHYYSFPSIERNRCSSYLCGRRKHTPRPSTAREPIIIRPCSREGQPCTHITNDTDGRRLSQTFRASLRNRDSLSSIVEGVRAEEIFPPRPATPARRTPTPTAHGSVTRSTGGARRASVPSLPPLNSILIPRASSPTTRPPTRHGPLPPSERGFNFDTLGELLSAYAPGSLTSSTRPTSPRLHHIHGLPNSKDYPYVHRHEVAQHLEVLRASSPRPLSLDANVEDGLLGTVSKVSGERRQEQMYGEHYADTVFHQPLWGGAPSDPAISTHSLPTQSPTTRLGSGSRSTQGGNTSVHPPLRRRTERVRRVSLDLGSRYISEDEAPATSPPEVPNITGSPTRLDRILDPLPAAPVLDTRHASGSLLIQDNHRPVSVNLELGISEVYRSHGHTQSHTFTQHQAHRPDTHPRSEPHHPPISHAYPLTQPHPLNQHTSPYLVDEDHELKPSLTDQGRDRLARHPTSTTVHTDTPTPTPPPDPQTPSVFAGRRLELRGGSPPSSALPRLRGGAGSRRESVPPSSTSSSFSSSGAKRQIARPSTPPPPAFSLSSLLPSLFHKREQYPRRLKAEERLPKVLWYLAGGIGPPITAREWRERRGMDRGRRKPGRDREEDMSVDGGQELEAEYEDFRSSTVPPERLSNTGTGSVRGNLHGSHASTRVRSTAVPLTNDNAVSSVPGSARSARSARPAGSAVPSASGSVRSPRPAASAVPSVPGTIRSARPVGSTTGSARAIGGGSVAGSHGSGVSAAGSARAIGGASVAGSRSGASQRPGNGVNERGGTEAGDAEAGTGDGGQNAIGSAGGEGSDGRVVVL